MVFQATFSTSMMIPGSDLNRTCPAAWHHSDSHQTPEESRGLLHANREEGFKASWGQLLHEQETSRNVPVPSVTTFRQSFWDTIRLEAIATRFPFKLIRHLSSVCIYIYICANILPPRRSRLRKVPMTQISDLTLRYWTVSMQEVRSVLWKLLSKAVF